MSVTNDSISYFFVFGPRTRRNFLLNFDPCVLPARCVFSVHELICFKLTDSFFSPCLGLHNWLITVNCPCHFVCFSVHVHFLNVCVFRCFIFDIVSFDFRFAFFNFQFLIFWSVLSAACVLLSFWLRFFLYKLGGASLASCRPKNAVIRDDWVHFANWQPERHGPRCTDTKSSRKVHLATCVYGVCCWDNSPNCLLPFWI